MNKGEHSKTCPDGASPIPKKLFHFRLSNLRLFVGADIVSPNCLSESAIDICVGAFVKRV